MTSILKFYKDLEKYGLIKDSQFILNIPLELLSEIFDDVKYLHKQELIHFANDFWNWSKGGDFDISDAEQYYQETFVSKGSDEHISDISKMVELPQQEISDEEIEKAANGHFEGDLMWSERIAFKLAIKWYREQLKTK